MKKPKDAIRVVFERARCHEDATLKEAMDRAEAAGLDREAALMFAAVAMSYAQRAAMAALERCYANSPSSARSEI